MTADTDLEERLRHQLGEAAALASPPVHPPPGFLSEVRRRRSRRLLSASCAAAIVVVGAVALVTVASNGQSDPVVASGPPITQGAGEAGQEGPAESIALRLELSALPEAPLDARIDASGVWTGNEFIVWGGAQGNKLSGEVLADGAAYDPERQTWRRLAPAPLSARTRHSSAWTGEEMIVWGGTSRIDGVGGLRDGAAYDPAKDTWRAIADAPADRTNGEAEFVGGRMIVGGGGSPNESDLSSLLVYDVQRDTWDVEHVGAPVVDLSSGSGVVAVGAHDAVTGDTSFFVLDPMHPKLVSAPPFPGVERAGATTVVWGEDRLIAAVASDEGDVTTVASWRPDESEWKQVSTVPAFEFRPRASRNSSEPDEAVWFGGWVVLVNGALGPQAVALATDDTIRLDVEAATCGVGAAQAFGDDVSFRWGGQDCDGANAGKQVDAGRALVMHAEP